MQVTIAIDTSPLKTGHAVRGIGIYTKNLIEAFGKFPFDFAQGRQIQIEEYDKKKNYDIIHYPYFDLFNNTLPIIKKATTVVTIHDVIPLLFPKYYPPGIKGQIRFLIQKYSLQSVSAVITDSECSKRDIVKYLNFPDKKIYVIYLAPSENIKRIEDESQKSAIKKRYNLPNNFVLYTGGINYNKNIPNLVRACEVINIPLVIVGKQAADKSIDKNHIENRDLVWLQNYVDKHQKQVLLVGFVSESDLSAIYSLATLYCQPSYYEGFGIPVLEAMVCGCPVVCSNNSSLREITGNAAVKFDPLKKNDLENTLKKVLNDKLLRTGMVQEGLLQVKKFSWEKTARETQSVYEKIIKES